jgi:MoxR-like ATPase
VILTSNRTRELHDALKRRCLYTWIGFPDAEREIEIVRARVPGISERLATQVVGAVNQLRQMELEKVPGVAETIDWVESLDALGANDLTERSAADTLGAVIKDRDDLDYTMKNLNDIVPSS